MKYGRTGAPSIPDSEKLSDIYELVLQYYGDVAVDCKFKAIIRDFNFDCTMLYYALAIPQYHHNTSN